jgi:hypothetical protein
MFWKLESFLAHPRLTSLLPVAATAGPRVCCEASPSRSLRLRFYPSAAPAQTAASPTKPPVSATPSFAAVALSLITSSDRNQWRLVT